MKAPTILFENDEVLVLNKPAGLQVHEDGRTKEEVLTHWIEKNSPRAVA